MANPIMLTVKHHTWNLFPNQFRDIFLKAAELGWRDSHTWNDKDLQRKIERRVAEAFVDPSSVNHDVPLSTLGVKTSRAQIDIVVHGDFVKGQLGGFLVQISGHRQPRHEKELIEFMSVSLMNSRFALGVLIVCSDNHLGLEGKATSFDYCKGPLLRLAEPTLKASNLSGLLIIGLPTPGEK